MEKDPPAGQTTGVLTELAKFYKTLLPKPSTTITFLDRNDFYTLMGQDAVLVSKKISHNSPKELRLSPDATIEYVHANKTQFESAVRELLLVHLYRVEVYDVKTKTISYKASPGNISQFEDILFSPSSDSTQLFGVAAISVTNADNNIHVGVAMADQTTREFTIAEFIDNDRFTNLESVLVQFNAKEVLIRSGDTTPQAVRNILQHSNCLLTERKKGDFAAKSITQDLERLVKRKSDVAVDALPEMEKKLAVECLAVLINYLDFMSDEANFNKFCLKTFDISRYVKLDTAVVKSLNLIPSTSDSKEMCLYKLLNNCKTVSGQRLLKQWILQPLVDVNKIEERLDLVEVFILDSLIRQTIHEQHLSSLPDFTKIAKKLSLGKATLQDCYRVYQGLSKLPDLDSTLDEYTGEHRVLMNSVLSSELKELITDLSKFSALIEEVLDMDSVKTMEFLVRADFEEALGEIGEQMKALEKGMDRELQKVASELGLEAGKALKLESSSHLGYFLRLTRKDEKLIRNNKNFQILDTKKDGVRFTNRKLSKLSPEHLELKRSYQKLQVDVVTEVIKVAGGYAESLYRIGDLVSQLDVVISLAIASTNATLPYVRPKMLPKGSGVAELKELRHPCLEAIDVDVIPNDCVFNAENSMFHIITGPNMGGKSTYIRSVALTFLMAQMGSFVPCESATVTVVDSIMCRVGAGDSQLKGISTFMAEMLESSAILKAASESSLIVIDELGRGTATYDGFGLAWGISHYIATELKCFTLFATHFHEMTALADEVPHVTNMHVSALAEMNQMTLLYKVLPGVCDQSFGLHVAKMVNFPERVLEYARHKSQQLEDVESHATLDSLSSQITEEVKCARRKERIESYDLLQGFSDRLKELSSSTPSDILTGVEAIKQEMLQHGNSFIRSLASC